MKHFFRFAIIVLVLSGCTPQKRLARILDRHPELMEQTEKEIVITKIDTAFFPGDSASVTFDLSIAKELASSYDGRWTIAEVDAVRSHAALSLLDPGKGLYSLSVATKPDTFIIVRSDTVKVPEVIYSTRTEYIEKGLSWHDKFLSGFGLLAMIILILFLCYALVKRFFYNH